MLIGNTFIFQKCLIFNYVMDLLMIMKKQLKSIYQQIINQRFSQFLSIFSVTIIANLIDPIFQTSIKDVINNREDLQKYLLATSDLNDSIQESFDLVVTDADLNHAVVQHASDSNLQTDFF